MKSHKAINQYVAAALAACVYIALTLATPLTAQANIYHLSLSSLHLLQATLLVPIIAIWFIALYGAARFYRYAYSISDSQDGRHLSTIADGLMVLVLGLIGTQLVQALSPLMRQVGQIQAWAIFANYLAVFLPLIGFYRIYQGSTGLASIASPKKIKPTLAIVITVVLVVFYALSVFSDSARNVSPDALRVSSYWLPDWLIVTTLMLPYTVLWYLGISIVRNLNQYHRYVKGAIYKQALKGLQMGLLAVVIFSILLQMLSAVGPALANWGLGSLLILIYVIIALFAVGYIFIARAARLLSKIEEVV